MTFYSNATEKNRAHRTPFAEIAEGGAFLRDSRLCMKVDVNGVFHALHLAWIDDEEYRMALTSPGAIFDLGDDVVVEPVAQVWMEFERGK